MPSPPRSLEEAVQRIARALADDDGSGWWGEEDGVPAHAPVARQLLEAAGVSALLERLEEVERERDEAIQLWDKNRSMAHRFSDQRAIAEARVASLEEENARLEAALDIAQRTEPCPYCEQAEEHGDDCEACLGCGYVVRCKRCNGFGGIGPEGDRNCPDCSGDGVDEDETARQVAQGAAGPLPGDTE